MNLKFSLRDLLLLTALISVACAALAGAGIWWHSVVVTATLISMTLLVIWGILNPGAGRAFACGWLLFVVGYLALIFGPWTGSNLGVTLITAKGLAELELKTRQNNPSPPVLVNSGDVDLGYDVSYILANSINRPYNLSSLSPYSSSGFADVFGRSWVSNYTTFQSTGHWLIASVLGYVGGHLAAFLWLRRNVSCGDPGRNSSGIPLTAS